MSETIKTILIAMAVLIAFIGLNIVIVLNQIAYESDSSIDWVISEILAGRSPINKQGCGCYDQNETEAMS